MRDYIRLMDDDNSEVPTSFVAENFAAALFSDVNLANARFRESNLAGSRMTGVLLNGAEIDGVIDGLIINGVEVAPLVEAELDRRYPERVELRPTDASSARRALAVVEQFWAPTMSRAAELTDQARRRSVDGEWSFVQTLRHLVFVTDAWFRRSVLDLPQPFSPTGLPPSFIHDGAEFGIDHLADASFEELVQLRSDRSEQLRTYLQAADDETLTTPGPAATGPGFPPTAPRTPLDCLGVILSEEWEHHRFAVRDLNAD